MSAFLILVWVLTAAYLLLMLLFQLGWQLTPDISVSDNADLPSVSIIIPARNEAENIGDCLRAIEGQNYPKELLEVIVVDDHSEDQTAEIATAFAGVTVLHLKDLMRMEKGMVAYKKMALSAGIAHSKGTLILTTDADCVAGENWIRSMALYQRQTKAGMIAGPVVFEKKSGMLSTFQSLDFMTMQGITAAVLRFRLGSMANGANLLFTRAAFEAVKGYEGATHLASGDDYLLMNKLRQQNKDSLYYLKSRAAIVTTAPQPDLNAFFQQRVRWASKSGKYKDAGVTAMLLLVYLLNLSLLLLFSFGFWQVTAWQVLWKILLLKIVAELILLMPVAGFFKRRSLLLWFPWLQPLHILYVVSAGFFGMLGSYSWKGRKVK